MLRFGLDVAEAWLVGLIAALNAEAELLSAVVFRRASVTEGKPGRIVYHLLYQTGGRRGSPWQIGYELLDVDGDGIEDTLNVIRIRHAASDPNG